MTPAELSAALAQTLDIVSQFAEAAQGLRAKMEADGWSPTAAEQVASEMLLAMIRKSLQ